MTALLMGLLLVATGSLGGPQTVPPVRVSVNPTEIQAGMFYSGATLRITVDAPEGLPLAISCVGEEGRLEMKVKGKNLGLIWMNVGDVVFEPVPNVYLLATSTGMEDPALEAALVQMGVGYGALEARADPEDPALFREMIRLKESEGLFSVQEGELSAERIGDGMERTVAEFRLPAKTHPGQYRILVHAFSQGRGELVATERVALVQTGITASIASLATNHGLLYGFFAAAIAVVVGLATGVVFGLGSKKGH